MTTENTETKEQKVYRMTKFIAELTEKKNENNANYRDQISDLKDEIKVLLKEDDSETK